MKQEVLVHNMLLVHSTLDIFGYVSQKVPGGVKMFNTSATSQFHAVWMLSCDLEELLLTR
jgi:hypothetical protein